MTNETMKYFFEEARCQDWSAFKECAQFSPTDNYEVCADKLQSVLICFPEGDTHGWRYFQAVYEDIPMQHRMPLLLEVVYQNYIVDYPSMLCMIADYVKHQETPEMKENRIAAVKGMLDGYVNANGKVAVFRGMGEGSLLPRSAVSFSVSKEVADFFVVHDKIRHHSRFGGVYRCEVDVEDILYYSNERNEKEVFIIPEDIKSGVYGYNNDLGFLSLWTLNDYFPSEYKRITKRKRFSAWDYPKVFSRIAPDNDPIRLPLEIVKAMSEGRTIDDPNWFQKHLERCKNEYQKKKDDEYARYLKARRAV